MSYLDRKNLLTADLGNRDIVQNNTIKYCLADKNVAYFYMKLIVNNPDGFTQEISVEEAINFRVTINIRKPGNQIKELIGELSNDLIDETCAIYKFTLAGDYTDQVNDYLCETIVKNGAKELVLNPFTYFVTADIATGLNAEIITDKDYSILKELISKVQKTNNINDNEISNAETYSNEKIEERIHNTANLKADKTEVDIERKRIDTIIALPPGSTTNDARLEDIKIGADNVNYDSPGDAVRTQFANNNNKIKSNESKNTEQDTRLNDAEYISKRQDTLLNGLLSENADKRLSIEGSGNSVKLDNSKDGTIEVGKVVGDSLVNLKTTERNYVVSSSNNNAYFSLISNSTTNIKGTILDTSVNLGLSYCYLNFMKFNVGLLKPTTVFTVILDNKTDCLASVSMREGSSLNDHVKSCVKVNQNVYIVTTKDTFEGLSSDNIILYGQLLGNYSGSIDTSVIGIFEGDLRNKPIPTQAFEGIQSSFEDKLVTQEMINAGTEKAENLGKYKAEVKVVGKNKFDGKLERGNLDANTGIEIDGALTIIRSVNFIKVKPNTNYIISSSLSISNGVIVCQYDRDYKFIKIGNTTSPNTNYIKFRTRKNDSSNFTDSELSSIRIQLEEVPSATTQPTHYEPYKEFLQSLYLNEPLYKNNVLCVHNGQLGYWKNCDKGAFDGSDDEKWNLNNKEFYIVGLNQKPRTFPLCDTIPSKGTNYTQFPNNTLAIQCGNNYSITIRNDSISSIIDFKAWLQSNPATVIYELAEPIFVPVLDNTPKWILECFNDCSVSFESNVPIQSSSYNYTSNVVSVVALEKIQYEQDKVAVENAYKLSVLGIMTGTNI